MIYKSKWIFTYIATILAINVFFSYTPREWQLIGATGAGFVFVSRDYVQRQYGKWWAIPPMIIGIYLSYLLASQFVALASAIAFAASETVDWLIFTITKRPLKDRILWSCPPSAVLDTIVFLSMLGALNWYLFWTSVASKSLAAVMVWGGYMRTTKLRSAA